MNDNWYSDSALAKQAEAERRMAADEKLTTDLMLGILQPRVAPTSEEQCHCCGTDARKEVGGNGSYCFVCLSRGHDELEDQIR